VDTWTAVVALAGGSKGLNADLTVSRRNLTGVTGTTHGRQAARGRLVRLLAVVAVLVGLALTHGFQCTDDMTTMYGRPGVSSSMAEDVAQDAHAADRMIPADTGALGLVEGGSPGPRGLGGVLATCLAFIVAVVAGVLGLRRAGLGSVVGILQSAGVVAIRVVVPRAPSLAELCVLRT